MAKGHTRPIQQDWAWFLIPALLAGCCMLSPLIPGESDAYLGTSVIVSAAWAFLLVAWSLAGFFGTWPRLPFDRADRFVLAFYIFVLGSTFYAICLGNPRLAWNDWSKWTGLLLVPVLVRMILIRPFQQKAMVLLMLAMAAAQSAYGFYQVWYTMPMTREAYLQDPDATLRDLGIHAPPDSALRFQFENRLNSPEPLATFALTNSLAGFLLPWWLVALGQVFSHFRAPGGFRKSLPFLLVVVLAGACLVMTNSRSAWVAAATGVALLCAARCAPRTQRYLASVIAVAGAVAAASWLGGFRGGPVAQAAATSMRYRFEYWIATWKLIQDRPWFGCGPGQFQDAYLRYKLPQASETIADPHNLMFEVAAVFGVPALFCFAVLWLTTFVRRTPGGSLEPAGGVAGPPSQRKEVNAMLLGGLLGVLLAYPLGNLVGFPPDLAFLWVGIPAAIAVIYFAEGWLQTGVLSRPDLAVSLVAIGVHLMAAGGISFPGVGIGVWMIWALMLQKCETPHADPPGRTCANWTTLVTSVALMLVIVTQVYQPVLRAGSSLRLGDYYFQQAQAGQGSRARQAVSAAQQAYQAAAQADRYSPEPWLRLASLLHWQMVRQTDAQSIQKLRAQFEAAAGQSGIRQPQSYGLYRQLGRWYLSGYRHTNLKADLAASITAFATAAELYPNRALAHAELAWAAWIAGDQDAARVHAARALELDGLNPHAEHGLQRQVLEDTGPDPRWRRQQIAGPQGADVEQSLRKILPSG